MNINKVIDLHRYAYRGKDSFRLLLLLGHACYLLMFKTYRSIKISDTSSTKKNIFVFFKSLHRPDYDILFDRIASTCDAPKLLVQAKVSYGFDFSFLRGYAAELKYYKEIVAENSLERLYLFVSYLFYKKILRHFNGIDFNCFVAFADMQPVESFLVQYYRDKEKKTVTLQHGLFLDHGWNSNLNEINYTNIVSEYFLTWGKENKKLIEKYDQYVKIVVCGNPTIMPVKEVVSEIKEDFFSVMFDSNLWRDYNQRMLDIAICVAKSTGKKILIRFHPANNIEDYDIDKRHLVNDNTVDYYRSQFILGHTSSMIHVCMRQGLVVFKMLSDMPHSYIDPKFYFSDCKNILDKIENLDVYKEIDYNHIEYIAEESLAQYKLFFNDMLLKLAK